MNMKMELNEDDLERIIKAHHAPELIVGHVTFKTVTNDDRNMSSSFITCEFDFKKSQPEGK